MKSIAVYCGSRSGDKPAYTEAARELGKLLAEQNIRLIYGGGSVGLMGTIADAVLEAGGEVTGVITEYLNDKELGHKGLQELIVVETMHHRKQKMIDLSEGFITMPGGVGSMEELFEVIAWGHLSIHKSPVGILNIGGYYDSLLGFLDEMANSGFQRPEDHASLSQAVSPADLLAKMESWKPIDVPKWDVVRAEAEGRQ